MLIFAIHGSDHETAERENRFEEYFGCRVKYRATRDAIILRAADLELPFVTHNDELLQMLAPRKV